MKMSFLRLVSLALVQTFIAQELAFAAPELPKFDLFLTEKPEINFTLPESIATMEDSWKAPSGSRTLFLIQDAHTNESGQFNLSKSLDIILKKENISHVFLEAAFGDSSMPSFKQVGTPELRGKLAVPYVKKGTMHGDEYLYLSSRKDFIPWGVEDFELYKKSVETYRDVAKDREKFHLYLKKITQTLDTLKPKILNPLLLSFHEKYESYRDGQLSLTEYFKILFTQAKYSNLSLKDYPNLKLLNTLAHKEAKIDFAKANEEQGRFIQSFGSEEQAELIELAKDNHSPFKLSGKEHKEDRAFYTLLEEKLKQRTIDSAGDAQDARRPIRSERSAVTRERMGLPERLATKRRRARPQIAPTRVDEPDVICGGQDPPNRYVELIKYFKYLKLAKKIEAKGVLDEITRLENEVLKSLSTDKDEETLILASKQVRHLHKLFDLTLTPEEFDEYKFLSKTLDIATLTGFLNKKIMDFEKYYERTVFLESGYEEIVRQSEEFYYLTYQRDIHFVNQTLKKMEEASESRAALITGGYHTPNLKSLLKAKGVSYVVITPQVLKETNRKRYEKILLGQDIKPVAPVMNLGKASTIAIGRFTTFPTDAQAYFTELAASPRAHLPGVQGVFKNDLNLLDGPRAASEQANGGSSAKLNLGRLLGLVLGMMARHSNQSRDDGKYNDGGENDVQSLFHGQFSSLFSRVPTIKHERDVTTPYTNTAGRNNIVGETIWPTTNPKIENLPMSYSNLASSFLWDLSSSTLISPTASIAQPYFAVKSTDLRVSSTLSARAAETGLLPRFDLGKALFELVEVFLGGQGGNNRFDYGHVVFNPFQPFGNNWNFGDFFLNISQALSKRAKLASQVYGRKLPLAGMFGADGGFGGLFGHGGSVPNDVVTVNAGSRAAAPSFAVKDNASERRIQDFPVTTVLAVDVTDKLKEAVQAAQFEMFNIIRLSEDGRTYALAEVQTQASEDDSTVTFKWVKGNHDVVFVEERLDLFNEDPELGYIAWKLSDAKERELFGARAASIIKTVAALSLIVSGMAGFTFLHLVILASSVPAIVEWPIIKPYVEAIGSDTSILLWTIGISWVGVVGGLALLKHEASKAGQNRSVTGARAADRQKLIGDANAFLRGVILRDWDEGRMTSDEARRRLSLLTSLGPRTAVPPTSFKDVYETQPKTALTVMDAKRYMTGGLATSVVATFEMTVRKAILSQYEEGNPITRFAAAIGTGIMLGHYNVWLRTGVEAFIERKDSGDHDPLEPADNRTLENSLGAGDRLWLLQIGDPVRDDERSNLRAVVDRGSVRYRRQGRRINGQPVEKLEKKLNRFFAINNLNTISVQVFENRIVLSHPGVDTIDSANLTAPEVAGFINAVLDASKGARAANGDFVPEVEGGGVEGGRIASTFDPRPSTSIFGARAADEGEKRDFLSREEVIQISGEIQIQRPKYSGDKVHITYLSESSGVIDTEGRVQRVGITETTKDGPSTLHLTLTSLDEGAVDRAINPARVLRFERQPATDAQETHPSKLVGVEVPFSDKLRRADIPLNADDLNATEKQALEHLTLELIRLRLRGDFTLLNRDLLRFRLEPILDDTGRFVRAQLIDLESGKTIVDVVNPVRRLIELVRADDSQKQAHDEFTGLGIWTLLNMSYKTAERIPSTQSETGIGHVISLKPIAGIEDPDQRNAQLQILIAGFTKAHKDSDGHLDRLILRDPESLSPRSLGALTDLISNSPAASFIHVGDVPKKFTGLLLRYEAVDTLDEPIEKDPRSLILPISGIKGDALLDWYGAIRMARSFSKPFAVHYKDGKIDYSQVRASDIPDEGLAHFNNHTPNKLGKDTLKTILANQQVLAVLQKHPYRLPLAEQIPFEAILQGARMALRTAGIAA